MTNQFDMTESYPPPPEVWITEERFREKVADVLCVLLAKECYMGSGFLVQIHDPNPMWIYALKIRAQAIVYAAGFREIIE